MAEISYAGKTGSPSVVPRLGKWVDVTSTAAQPTGLGAGSGSYFYYKYREVGDSVEIDFLYTKDTTSGSGAVVVYFPMPPGLSGVITLMAGAIQTLNVSHSIPSTSNWVTTTGEFVPGSGLKLYKNGTVGGIVGAEVLANAQIRGRATVQVSGWDATVAQGAGVQNTVLRASLVYQSPQINIAPHMSTTRGGPAWPHARAVVYADVNGIYRMRFNITGTFTGVPMAAGEATNFTIAGVTFKTGQTQAITGLFSAVNPRARFYANGGGGVITGENGDAVTTGGMLVSGDVELESKPTWAT